MTEQEIEKMADDFVKKNVKAWTHPQSAFIAGAKAMLSEMERIKKILEKEVYGRAYEAVLTYQGSSENQAGVVARRTWEQFKKGKQPMTIKIIDKRTNQELSLRGFGVSVTGDNHLIWGWEDYERNRKFGAANNDFYEVTFPEVEELKKEIEKYKDFDRTLDKEPVSSMLAIALMKLTVEQRNQLLEALYERTNNKYQQRIADLELEVAGQQKIIDENMGFGSIVEDKRK